MSSSEPESPVDSDDARDSLRRRAVGGTLWTGIGHGVGQALRLGSNLLLTRLLFEEAFGLMLLVNVFLQALQTFSDVGINASVIQNPQGDEPRFLHTAWTVGALRSALLALACLALARPLASFYGHEELAALVPVAGLGILIGGLASPSLMTLERHIELKQLVLMNLGIQLVSMLVMITWAWLSPSVWALVAGSLTAAGMRLLVSYVIFGPQLPRVAWDRPSLIAIMALGSWILINTPLGFVADQADRFALGKLIPLAVLGVYQVASMVAGLPYQLLVNIGSAVIFPALSRARDQGYETLRLYRRARLPVETAGGWLVAGLIACGPVLIRLLWDERWHAAAWMLVPVAVSQWFRILSIPGANALFAEGRPSWLVAANSAKILGYLVFVPIGWKIGQLAGALVGFAAGESLAFLVYAEGLRRGGVRTLVASLGSCLLLLASAASGSFARVRLLEAGHSPWLVLVVAGLVASAFWLPLAASQRRLLWRTA